MKLVLFVRINSYSSKLHDLTKQNQNEMFENIVSKWMIYQIGNKKSEKWKRREKAKKTRIYVRRLHKNQKLRFIFLSLSFDISMKHITHQLELFQ